MAIPDVRQSLQDHSTEMLTAIALSRGLEAAQSRSALLEALVEASTGPLSLRLLWEGLGERERQAMVALADAGGQMAAVYFEHQYGALRHFGPARLMRERLWEQPQSVTERLYFLGLIFRGFSEHGEATVWYVPVDLRTSLPLPSGSLAPEPPSPLPGEPTLTRAADDLLASALYHVLAAITLGERPLLPAIERRLEREPAPPDDLRRAYFARLALTLSQEMGFVHQDRFSAKGRVRARAWLRLPWHEALRAVAMAWLQSSSWHELVQAPGLVFEGGRLPDASPARRTLVGQVASLQTGSWYAVGDFRAWVRASDPGFLRSDADFHSLHLRDQAGTPLDGLEAWTQVEGRFLEEVLVILNALTALSLGTFHGQRCFRPETGLWWARHEPYAGPPEEPALRLLPRLVLQLPERLSFQRRYQAEAIAEPTGTVGELRVTRASLRRARSRGVQLDGVLRFLSQHVSGFGEEAAKAVRALAGPAQVVAEGAVLLTPEDADTADRILGDAGMALCFLQVLPDGRLMLPSEHWPAAEARLKGLGLRVIRKDSRC